MRSNSYYERRKKHSVSQKSHQGTVENRSAPQKNHQKLRINGSISQINYPGPQKNRSGP